MCALSASAKSAAEGNRFSGFFSSAFAITCPSPTENDLPGIRSSSAIGGFVTWSWMYSMGVRASKGSLPVNTSYETIACPIRTA